MVNSEKRGRIALPAVIASVAVIAIGAFFGVDRAESVQPCAPGALHDEAFDTIDDIRAGGPFDYPDNDGARFGNYEGVLPDEQLGYYREYTVETPGLGHRGERRIVTGGGSAQDPDHLYYTDDHYETFCEVPHA